jgi:hypothetical protein
MGWHSSRGCDSVSSVIVVTLLVAVVFLVLIIILVVVITHAIESNLIGYLHD